MSDTHPARPFTWDDVPALHRLLAQTRRIDDPRTITRIGDFWWTLRATPPDDFLRHMQAWPAHDGDLAAVAWLDPPDAGGLILAPGAESKFAESLFDDCLDWLENEHRTAGAAALAIIVLDGDALHTTALGSRGYAPGATGNVRFWRSLETVPIDGPPGTASVRAATSDADLAARAGVLADAFGGAAITAAQWRSMTSRLPTYMPDLELIALAPDGAVASAITCWYDEPTRCGEIEAVGTSKQHLRTGLARGVIAEGLRRLRKLGATQAIVETTIGNDPAIALYRACGFDEIARDYAWTKPR